MQYVAFSGGKDSTAMALRMYELGEKFSLLFTPTMNELPELNQHLNTIARMCGKSLICLDGPTLIGLIRSQNALPNWRMRWCTRKIKIEPCISFLKLHPDSTLCVGFRADEESRDGIYGDYADYRYPLQEWGWVLDDVLEYLDFRNVTVPRRTDCALCFYQRTIDWYRLWKDHPDMYAVGEELERKTGYTFRNTNHSTSKWHLPLVEMRRRFENDEIPNYQRMREDGIPPCRMCNI